MHSDGNRRQAAARPHALPGRMDRGPRPRQAAARGLRRLPARAEICDGRYSHVDRVVRPCGNTVSCTRTETAAVRYGHAGPYRGGGPWPHQAAALGLYVCQVTSSHASALSSHASALSFHASAASAHASAAASYLSTARTGHVYALAASGRVAHSRADSARSAARMAAASAVAADARAPAPAARAPAPAARLRYVASSSSWPLPATSRAASARLNAARASSSATLAASNAVFPTLPEFPTSLALSIARAIS